MELDSPGDGPLDYRLDPGGVGCEVFDSAEVPAEKGQEHERWRLAQSIWPARRPSSSGFAQVADAEQKS